MNDEYLNEKTAFAMAAAICSKTEKCSFDIEKKLQCKGAEEAVIESVIFKLKSENYINEKRYANAFVKDKFRFNRWGRTKIAYHLKMKGIPDSIVEEALKEIDETDYTQILNKLLTNKLTSLKKHEPYQQKAALIRFAQSRGFEMDFIYQELEKLL